MQWDTPAHKDYLRFFYQFGFNVLPRLILLGDFGPCPYSCWTLAQLFFCLLCVTPYPSLNSPQFTITSAFVQLCCCTRGPKSWGLCNLAWEEMENIAVQHPKSSFLSFCSQISKEAREARGNEENCPSKQVLNF